MVLLGGRIRAARLRRPRARTLGLVLGVVALLPGAPGISRTLTAARSPALVGVTFRAQGGGWKLASGGQVVPFGGAKYFGSPSRGTRNEYAAIASTGDGGGYWVVTRSGHVTAFGDARSYGSIRSHGNSRPVVGMAALPDGRGYWLLNSGGQVIAFGAARWYGSPFKRRLPVPASAIAAAPDGRGYWTLSVRGNVLAFGDARWAGSPAASRAAGQYVGLTAAPAGFGYWIGSANGYVRAYGAARRATSPVSRAAASVVSLSTVGHVYGLLTRAGSIVVWRRAPAMPSSTSPSSTSPTTASASTTASPPPSSSVPPTSPPTSPVPTTVAPTPSTTPPPAPTTTVPAPPTTTPSAPGSPTPSSLSFGMFSHPLPATTAPLPSSSQFASDFVNDYQSHYGAVAVNQMPVWTVPADQAPVPVHVKAGCANFTTNTGTAIPIPPAATTTGTGDSPLVIDQPSTSSEWELWQASPTGNGWSACWGGRLDTSTSDGVFPNGYGLSGSGISYLATTITEADIASGSIDHAIALDLPACSAPQVFPADRTDCSNDPGQPPEGTWWRFPSNLPMPPGLTPFGKMVFEAIQTYGLVQTDQAGAVAIQAENTADWAAQGHSGVDPITASWQGQQEWQVVADLPWSHIEAISAP